MENWKYTREQASGFSTCHAFIKLSVLVNDKKNTPVTNSDRHIITAAWTLLFLSCMSFIIITVCVCQLKSVTFIQSGIYIPDFYAIMTESRIHSFSFISHRSIHVNCVGYFVKESWICVKLVWSRRNRRNNRKYSCSATLNIYNVNCDDLQL